jgi:cob(I)alamin adenosyltransferase
MKIYTKTGDKGTTSLGTGERISKAHPIVEAIGTVDELNSIIGTIDAPSLSNELKWIQDHLFIIGASLANPDKYSLSEHVEQTLEEWIDAMEVTLPKLRNFILPKGQIHFARTVCRRAERCVVWLDDEKFLDVIKYLNRLSDFLFVAARKINHLNGVEEHKWSG